MYDRKIQETRSKKEQQRVKKVVKFYLFFILAVLIISFLEMDSFGFATLIFGVRGVIIKGISYNSYMVSYGFKEGYLKAFTIFNFIDFLQLNKPNFISTIKYKYIFFDKYEITFIRRQKLAIIHKNDKYFFVDEQGILWGHPTIKDILSNVIVFNIDNPRDVDGLKGLTKYASIISEIDYGNKVIYLRRGKIVKLMKWADIITNREILGYVYSLMKNRKELYLIKNKIMIK